MSDWDSVSTPAPASMTAPKEWDAVSKTASQPSTLGYIGSRFLGSAAQAGNDLMQGQAAEAGFGLSPDQRINGQDVMDKMIYGRTGVQPPGPVARYGGAVASAFGSNPAMGVMMPGYTAAGAVGGEGASDVNKATGSVLPDWLARLIGGGVGSLGYGGLKTATTSLLKDSPSLPADLAGDKDAMKAAELANKQAAGGNRIGMYQGAVKYVDKSLDDAAGNMPTIQGDTSVPLNNTLDVLTKPRMGPALPEVADSLATTIDKNGGALPFSAVKEWQTEIGDSHPELYGALKADRRAAVSATGGADAGSAFDAANTAREAKMFLTSTKNSYGNFDPQKFTQEWNSLSPAKQAAFASNPQIAELAQHAQGLSDMVSPVVRANASRGGLAREAAGVASIAAGHAGLPGGEMLGGLLLGGKGASTANPLYVMQKQGIPPWALNQFPALFASQRGGLLDQGVQ